MPIMRKMNLINVHFWTYLPGRDASPSQVTPGILSVFSDSSPGYLFILLGGRGAVRVKCLAQEHNTMTRPGLERAPLDPECGSIKTRVQDAIAHSMISNQTMKFLPL